MAEYLLPYEGSSYRQVDTPLSWVEAQVSALDAILCFVILQVF